MFKKSVLFIALFILGINLYSQTATIDKPSPDFTLKDNKGNIHNLSDYKGKKVVLEWVNFDCPFVVKHYSSKNMQNLQREFVTKGVIWLSICSSAPGKQGNFSPIEITKRVEERNALMTAYLIDEDGKVGKLYGAKTTPHIFIINEEGTLVYDGAIDSKKSINVEDIPKSINFIREVFDALSQNITIPNKVTVPYGCSVKY